MDAYPCPKSGHGHCFLVKLLYSKISLAFSVYSVLAATEEGLRKIRQLLLIGIASHHSFMSDVSLSSYTLLFKPLFDNFSEEEEKFLFPQVSSPLTKERLENITQMRTEVSGNRKWTENPKH